MSYDEITAIYMAESEETISEPAVAATPARRLRDALEPIATQGWWSRQAADGLGALGLGFFDAYVWGRAASLGEPTSAVVAATFGVFDAALVDTVYEQGRTAAGRAEVLAARARGAGDSTATFCTDDEAAAVADPLIDVLATMDGMGRPLFSGLRALAVPESAAGRLWRAAELVREHRGDGHLAAAVAAGTGMLELNVLTELWLGYGLGEYSSSRGLDAERLEAGRASLERRGWVSGEELTDAGRSARDDLETATDRTQQQLMDALGDRLEAVVDGAAAISARIVAAKAFPTDPRKRAAG